jgi:hypothetical protein
MRFPWANVILLLLLSSQLVTGYAGMVNGRSQLNWVLWLHGIGAYALLVLIYWKSEIILDVWRRKTVWTWRRISFVIMSVLLLITLGMGLIWTFNGPVYLFGFSLMSLHIYVAVPMMLLMVWHSWQMRFIFRVRETLGRRFFVNTAVTTTVGLLFWRTAGWGKQTLKLQGGHRRFTGSYEKGSFSPHFPVVSWIFDFPDPIDPECWELAVVGAVKRPFTLTYAALRQFATESRTATIDCTGGWYAKQIWTGVDVAWLLEMAGLADDAASVTFRAVSGYKRRFTLAEARTFLLALDVASEPLSHGHGAPIRLVAAEKRGMEWVKWVTHIEVNTSSKVWQSPLPLQ